MTRYVLKLPPLDPCPVEHVVALVGRKWKARILHRLSLGCATIGELRRHLPRVSAQVLKAQLAAMEADNLVRRRPPEPGQIWGAFAITDRGRSLHNALRRIATWGADDIGGWIEPTLAA